MLHNPDAATTPLAAELQPIVTPPPLRVLMGSRAGRKEDR
jgi:hypothetical protein